jgi:hypothetical protein
MEQDWLLQANAMTHNRRVETNRQPPEIERASKAAQEACARAEKQYVPCGHLVLELIVIGLVYRVKNSLAGSLLLMPI